MYWVLFTAFVVHTRKYSSVVKSRDEVVVGGHKLVAKKKVVSVGSILVSER